MVLVAEAYSGSEWGGRPPPRYPVWLPQIGAPVLDTTGSVPPPLWAGWVILVSPLGDRPFLLPICGWSKRIMPLSHWAQQGPSGLLEKPDMMPESGAML
ncbi:Hypothetical predicted protein [Pelobates cultripes]|uniref:Uncharacterized protein n=1 Tax=Pelobates cultripes TaxID=61616 RepID=A0AAD1SAJ5_PELCU|nr:Hypothetical predicted protein [Pelobates cultripes]